MDGVQKMGKDAGREFDTYCPVCGSQLPGEMPEDETCRNCMWQDEPYCDQDPDWKSGANQDLTLNEAKELYRKHKKVFHIA